MDVNASPGQTRGFLEAVRQAIGEGSVQGDAQTVARYARSTEGPPTPSGGVVYPRSTPEVQAVVRLAAEHNVPLHPISRGKNWGYGDARPPRTGQVIVDLSRMNKILEVDANLAFVRLEAGVSQGELYDYLQQNRIPLWMDATGAGRDASVVGNTLDRGFGHTRYGDHFLTACGMTVVLADGRVLHTSSRGIAARTGTVYRYGVGPFIDGLFAQSNFGIVTELTLWLMPRPEAFEAFFIRAPREQDLAVIVDGLAPLRRHGLLQSTIHIGNDLRVLSARMRYPFDRAKGVTPLPEDLRAQLRRENNIGAWNVAGAIYGPKAHVRATKALLRKALRPLRVVFVDDAKLALAKGVQRGLSRVGQGERLGRLLQAVEPTYELLQGKPTDEPLWGASWRSRDGDSLRGSPDPLDTHAGLLWVSPVTPQRGSDAEELVSVLDPIYRAHGFEPLLTFTMINERAMICVSNVAFDTREAGETERAHACYHALNRAVVEHGFLPYRLGPAGYADVWSASSDTSRDLLLRLKEVFDPRGIFSPGRYIPDRSKDEPREI